MLKVNSRLKLRSPLAGDEVLVLVRPEEPTWCTTTSSEIPRMSFGPANRQLMKDFHHEALLHEHTSAEAGAEIFLRYHRSDALPPGARRHSSTFEMCDLLKSPVNDK